MTGMTGPDCAVMCNLINTHTHTHTTASRPISYSSCCRHRIDDTACQQREEARRHLLRAEPHNSNHLQKAVKMTGKNLRKVRKAAVLSVFWHFVRKLEIRTREGDQADFYKDTKTMNTEGKRDRSSAYIKHEDGVHMRDVELVPERWVLHTLLDAKSLKLNPNITEGRDRWPENMPLGVQPMVQELTGVVHSLANRMAVGPNGVSVELFKITRNGDSALCRRLLDITDVSVWREVEVPQQQWEDAIIEILHKKQNRTGASCW